MEQSEVCESSEIESRSGKDSYLVEMIGKQSKPFSDFGEATCLLRFKIKQSKSVQRL